MKKIFAALALVLTGTSIAQAEMVAVEPSLVPGYVSSLARAVSSSTLSCKGGEVSEVSSTLLRATEIWIDNSGAQPAILAVTQRGNYRTLLLISTSADYTKLDSVTSSEQRLEKVNKAANLIAKPSIQEEWIDYSAEINCRLANK
jgi:hypothetical protein